MTPIKAYRAPSGRLRIESGHEAMRKAERDGIATLFVTVKGEGRVELHLTADGYREAK